MAVKKRKRVPTGDTLSPVLDRADMRLDRLMLTFKFADNECPIASGSSVNRWLFTLMWSHEILVPTAEPMEVVDVL